MIVPSDQKNLPLSYLNSLSPDSIHRKYFDNSLKYEAPKGIYQKLKTVFSQYSEFEDISKFYPNQKLIEATKLEYAM